jgi:hypothetical protein
MKCRKFFVSNSSSSSFICNVCGTSEVGFDEHPSGWLDCVNGHTLCDGCIDGNTETVESDDYGSSIQEKDCPICQFTEICYDEMAKYLEKQYLVSRDEAFYEIKQINKRRKKLYNTEYVEYVCRKKGFVVQELLASIKESFKTYKASFGSGGGIKLHLGFISNSSSCSFIVSKDSLTKENFLKAKHYLVSETDEDDELYLDVTGWNCHEREMAYSFETSLDNFCMIGLLQRLGVRGDEFLNMRHSNAYDIDWAEDFKKSYGVKLAGD